MIAQDGQFQLLAGILRIDFHNLGQPLLNRIGGGALLFGRPVGTLLCGFGEFARQIVYGGVWIVINQVDFGYFTKKPTILYVVGLKTLSQLPAYPIIFPRKLRKFSDLSPRQRSLTVIGLRDYFYAILLTILSNTQ